MSETKKPSLAERCHRWCDGWVWVEMDDGEGVWATTEGDRGLAMWEAEQLFREVVATLNGWTS